ncbi:MAG: phosphoribosylaminoimidazolesuccinocarboxamide synthase, partial [Gemmatimonadetes bacterium]|nr:phosphoribosylaminoimidazolesuccinocarboxamide synthase [Gemmatimonadota bacterium]
GKGRDVYEVGSDRLLIVASDRLSVFDVVLPTPIPEKGAILTQISNFWFERTKGIVPNHVVETDRAKFPEPFRSRAELERRSVLVKRAQRVDFECVARGYITGSAWSEYKKTGTVCNEKQVAGLLESQKFPEPIFTPATKADSGHDENISRAELANRIGADLARRLEDATINLYVAAEKYSQSRGIILADTKFEFGMLDGTLIVIDEALTPDSSRYWDAEKYKVGSSPASFDKQFVRDYTKTLNWDQTYPGPELPAQVVEGTTQRYRECYERITGKQFKA